MTMKKYFYFIVVLPFFLNAQSAVLCTFEKSSPNGLYKVIIKGNFYEGFSGKVSIELKTKKQKSVWKYSVNEQRNFILPAVSNTGLTALLYDGKVQFMDLNGKKIGEFQPDSGWVMYYDLEEFVQSFGCFSDDGSMYFDFVKKTNSNRTDSIWLFGINNKFSSCWSVNTGLTDPLHAVYKDHQIFVIDGVNIKVYNELTGSFIRLGTTKEIKEFERKSYAQ